ncbi:MAG: hypothetical protein NT028_03415 [candidate division Zixibacteria bacterium]|jgi:hypothetical protein|nr:hypothetical protein [candidate division Zixibacteria bacterium]
MKRICLLLLVVTAFLFATNSLTAGEPKVGGVLFANWKMHLNDQGQGKNFNSFDIARARLILDQQFGEKFSANMAIDLIPRSSLDGYGLQYRLRSAYIQGDKLIKYTTMRFGMQSLLWFDHVEKAWGLRYIDAVSLDKLGYLERADLGFTIIGECPGNYGKLALQIVNGGGFTKTEKNKNKDIILFATGYPFPKNPDFGETGIWAQYYKGWPNIAYPDSTATDFRKNTKKDRMQVAGVIKYRKWVSGVVEYFQTWDKEDVTTVIIKDNQEKAKGFSLMGKVNVATAETWLSKVYLFTKYEWIDKHTQLDKALYPYESQNGDARFFLGGVGYSPVEGYELAISIVRETTKVQSPLVNPVEIREDEKNSIQINMTTKF